MKGPGLTGNSESGVWVVRSGDRHVGPFNGRSPAVAFCREMRRQGVEAIALQLVNPAHAREWAALHAPGRNQP